MISLLGSRGKAEDLGLDRQDTEAEGCYLNPSSQQSKRVSPMLPIPQNISHEKTPWFAISQVKKQTIVHHSFTASVEGQG